jgi:hypothetical protein
VLASSVYSILVYTNKKDKVYDKGNMYFLNNVSRVLNLKVILRKLRGLSEFYLKGDAVSGIALTARS